MRKPQPVTLYFFAFAALLLIGLWHNFPNLVAIADESPYVGGVLRAFEAHSLIPHIDYSYSVSFLINYIVMAPFLGALFFLTGSIAHLQQFLFAYPFIPYFIPRLVSAACALLSLAVFYRLAKREGKSGREFMLLASIVFGSVIFFSIAHTGKMWMLSVLLYLLSFYFFDSVVRSAYTIPAQAPSRRSAFMAAFLPFIAFANFPFNVIAFLNIPLLLFIQRKTGQKISRPYWIGGTSGIALLALSFLYNLNGWLVQNRITPTEHASIQSILAYFGHGIFFVLPLAAIACVFCARSFPKRPQIALIGAQAALFIGLLILRATWAFEDPAAYYRFFIFPLIFLGLFLVYSPLRRQRLLSALALIAIIFMLKTPYLLAVPTTYSAARAYLLRHAGKDMVFDEVQYLDIPKTAEAYALDLPGQCESKCAYVMAHPGIIPGLFVIDADTDASKMTPAMRRAPHYLVTAVKQAGTPVFVADNGLASDFISVEHRLGAYSFDLLAAKRLGPTVYVYRR